MALFGPSATRRVSPLSGDERALAWGRPEGRNPFQKSQDGGGSEVRVPEYRIAHFLD
jgi:hypothetical protein